MKAHFMFGRFPQSELKIVAPDGFIRSVEKGTIDSKLAIIPNQNAIIFAGDEIRRTLPNGIEETFEVIDPVFYDGRRAIPAHFQVKISRKGSFPAGTGGNFTFNVSGVNARVNIGSHDSSQNIVGDKSIFTDLKNAVQTGLAESEERSRLVLLIEKMEAKVGDRPGFISAYQDFISAAANHMTVVAPFLPAVAKLLGWPAPGFVDTRLS
ncbi:MAG: hypothetical protein Q8M26_01045 [Pseudolabrys sp.]|nr:hypothetical protein [Pseudolabrys sp.]